MTTALLALLEAFLRLGRSILTSSSAMPADHTIRRGPRATVRASGRDETGRHAGFRCRWRKPWGFESLRPHSGACQRAVEHDDRVPREVDAVAVQRRAHEAAARGGLQPGQPVAAEAARPERRQRGVGAAGDRVLGDAVGGAKKRETKS